MALPSGLATVELFRRRRYSENLYAPARVGPSTGVGLEGLLRPTSTLELGARVRYERGETGWEQQLVELTVAYLLF